MCLLFERYFVFDYCGLECSDIRMSKCLIRRSKIPLEVKSSSSTRHRSLDLFKDKYRSRIDRTYVIHGKDLRVDGDVVYIPIYMTMFL